MKLRRYKPQPKVGIPIRRLFPRWHNRSKVRHDHMWQPTQPWRKCRWRICKAKRRQKCRKQFWKLTPCLVLNENLFLVFRTLFFLILHLDRGRKFFARFEKTKVHCGQNPKKRLIIHERNQKSGFKTSNFSRQKCSIFGANIQSK